MKSLAILLVCCCSTPASAALIFYDGFDYTAGQPLAPSNDTTGSPNPGQHNIVYNVDWRYAGAGGATNSAPGIASGSLGTPGLATPTGNSAAFDTSQLGSARIQVTPVAISSGIVYWSALLRVNDVNTLTTTANGMLLGGFNNTAGPGTLPGVVGAVLRVRQDPSNADQFFMGVGMNSGAAAGNVQFDNATARLEGQTVFVVGAYEFVAGSNNDKAHMWINPDVSTFGAGSAPTPSLTAAPGGTVADSFASLLTFNLRNINTVGNANIQFDELRVGDDWASVTVPEPASLGLLLMACVLLSSFLRRV